ncbi:MAG: tetratricopeptide repeat protein [Elusimicrobia bacterium]|nr:tetratricopeptide repeat protein [Elusimicrobiota bacterium]
MNDREKLEAAIAAQEALRPTLGDAVVDATVAALKEKLSALGAPAESEQRKQVTVLFADVSGFTAMSESLDAEAVRDTMNALWARLDSAIISKGGRVDKHIGDAVMALFGAGQAREDDPEQAVHAALAMHRELAAFAASSGHSLRMRIGINTGPVLLGTVGSTSEFTAMGDTVNLASRLEHAAPVGAVLIAQDTYLLARGIFDVDPLPPFQVKGKKDPVQAYVVNKALPRGLRLGTKAAPETGMVGREAELKALQDAFRQADEDRESQMVTVLGDAGGGKSRLLYEFRRWFDLIPAWLFLGRATAHTVGQPYHLWRDLFSLRFDILDSDPGAVVREKFERGVGGFLKEDAQAVEKSHFIGHLIGFDFSASPHLKGILGDAPQIRNRALAYLGQFFAAASAQYAILLLFEDLHWADDRSLDALGQLFESCPNLRLLCLCLARPGLLERRPSWGEGRTYHKRVDLRPLSKTDCRRLVAEHLAKVREVPKELRDLVVEAAEGNPFYIEELLRMLTEGGVIVRGDSSWAVDLQRLAGLKVPATVTGVLQARIDSLAEPERRTLQRASVVGRTFWDSTVRDLADQPGLPCADVLARLRERDMVFRRESSAFSDSVEFIFKHALLRDVAYESVLKKERPKYHAKAAEWLVAQAGERVEEFAGLIADHYEKAGERGKASDYLGKAGGRALRVSAYREARGFLQKALSLLPEEAPATMRAELLNQLAISHLSQAEYGPARACLELSLSLATESRDAKGMAEALIELFNVAFMQSDFVEGKRRAEECLRVSREANDRTQTGRALHGLAVVERNAGRYPEATALLDEALAILSELGVTRYLASGTHNKGAFLSAQGCLAEAKKHYQEALALYQELRDRQGVARALNSVGCICASLGEYAECIRLTRESLATAQDIGERRLEASALSGWGDACAQSGQDQEAHRLLLQSLALYRTIGDRAGATTALQMLGPVCARLGMGEEAQRSLRESLDISREIGNRSGIARSLTALGALGVESGRLDEAGKLLDESLVLSRELGNRALEASALDGLARLADKKGDALEAESRYREALSLFLPLGNTPDSIAALAGLAGLYARTSRLPAALELAGFALGHPALNSDGRRRAEEALGRLKPVMAPAEVEAGLARGAALILDDAVRLASSSQSA